MVPLSPAAPSSSLEKPNGVQGKSSTPLETKPCVGLLLRTDTGSPALGCPTPPHRARKGGLCQKGAFLPRSFMLRDRAEAFEIVPKANHSMFCKGQCTLELRGHTGMSTFSVAPKVSSRLKGVDWHGGPTGSAFPGFLLPKITRAY